MDLISIRRRLIETMSSGGLPAGFEEIKRGTFTVDAIVTSLYSIAHGCNGVPDIIVMWSDFETRYTASDTPGNATVVGGSYSAPGDFVWSSYVSGSYTGGTAPVNGGSGSAFAENNGCICNVTATKFDIKAAAVRRLDPKLTYQFVALRLAAN